MTDQQTTIPARRRLGHAAQRPKVSNRTQSGSTAGGIGRGPARPVGIGGATPAALTWTISDQRSPRRRAQLIDLMLLLIWLISLPLGVAWIIDERPGIGPVLFTLTSEHGVHTFDLVLLAIAVP